MGSQFSGPFWSHTEGYSPKEMEAALDHFHSVLESQGPFDGVVGFSQGAALAISYIHWHKKTHGVFPFKVALLFSSVCSFSPDTEYSHHTIQELNERDVSITSGDAIPDGLGKPEQALFDALTDVIKPLREGNALLPDIDLDEYFKGDHLNVPRLLLPELLDEKMGIPTLHMHGKGDAKFMRDMSLIARGLFNSSLMKTLEHSGTHHPPQKSSEIKQAVRAMEWAISKSQKMDLGR